MALVRREARPTEITPFRTWGPFSLLEEANRLFEEVLGDFARPTAAYVAPADLYETDEALILEMAVPGLSPEDLEVSLEGNRLTVRGQVKPVEEARVRRYYLQEMAHGSFVRTFSLPVEVDASQARAEFRHGILRLTMPKVAEARAKRIPVEVAR
ncbi:Hsp20/alpha crystallin family protein [Thermus thermamylovorans]|uniref:Hsp20/alpha crystallin family protein n=1 Tax=Thermus thermamylovorans TaxID=2509362 RepID=A0A4Q9B668_9DEIN|nr:Hsp20/alpha crystallin family protein [Thermus thermamylovorans]TBH21144.1 Hsp20/alpha crystallin family protein [Thermus thermamylovorans]